VATSLILCFLGKNKEKKNRDRSEKPWIHSRHVIGVGWTWTKDVIPLFVLFIVPLNHHCNRRISITLFILFAISNAQRKIRFFLHLQFPSWRCCPQNCFAASGSLLHFLFWSRISICTWPFCFVFNLVQKNPKKVRDLCALGCCSRFWRELCFSDCIWESLVRNRWPLLSSFHFPSSSTLTHSPNFKVFTDSPLFGGTPYLFFNLNRSKFGTSLYWFLNWDSGYRSLEFVIYFFCVQLFC